MKLSSKLTYSDENLKVIRLCENKASVTTCNCKEHVSFCLPCRYIFFTRNYFKRPLFNESLFDSRWKKEKLLTGNSPVEVSAKLHTEKSNTCIVTKERPDSIAAKSYAEKSKISVISKKKLRHSIINTKSKKEHFQNRVR